MKLRTFMLAAALTLGASSAHAEMQRIAARGAWVALAGTTSDTNRPMCQMNSAGDPARTVAIKWVNDSLYAHIGKANWQIPKGIQMPLSIRFDQETPFEGKAIPVPNYRRWIELRIGDDNERRFIEQFATADRMRVTFSGDEREWSLRMDGSDTIAQKFTYCITALKKKMGPATQPFDAEKGTKKEKPTFEDDSI